jgi:hypothetical protein
LNEAVQTMTGTYKITATPMLHPEGEYAGKLKRVIFTATSPMDKREWFANNCGQFEDVFTRIMPVGVARAIVAALLDGKDAEFPGLYREDEFERGFSFERSPIYQVAPSMFREAFSYARND